MCVVVPVAKELKVHVSKEIKVHVSKEIKVHVSKEIKVHVSKELKADERERESSLVGLTYRLKELKVHASALRSLRYMCVSALRFIK